MKATETRSFQNKTDSEKVLWILYDNPNSTQKNIVDKLLPCYISNLSNLACSEKASSENESNKGNKGNKVTGELQSKIKTYLYRHEEAGRIEKKAPKPYQYKLKPTTTRSIEAEIQQETAEAQEEAWRKAREEATKEKLDAWTDYLTQNHTLTALDDYWIEKNPGLVKLDFKDLVYWNFELAEDLLEDYNNNIQYVVQVINTHSVSGRRIEAHDVTIQGFESRSKIARIKASEEGKLLNIHAEVVAKGGLFNKALRIDYECPSCGTIHPLSQPLEDSKEQRPRVCACGRKGDFKPINKDTHTARRVTVQEIGEFLAPGETPQRLPCILVGPLAEESTERLNLSERVTLTGYYLEQQRVEARGAGSSEYDRFFVVVGVQALDEDLLEKPLTEAARGLLDSWLASEDPLEAVSSVIFKRVVGWPTAKQMLSLSAFGRLHLMLLGDPGIGKTELCKCLETAFHRAEVFQASNSSKAGITAAASKDEHTGRFVVEMNGLSRLHPHGVGGIDELNRSPESTQESLLGVMQDQVLKIRKTNIQADLPCDVSVVATANPKGDVLDGFKPLYDQVTVSKPLWDRFDFTLLFSLDLADVGDYKAYIRASGLRLSDDELLALREWSFRAWKVEPVLYDDETVDNLNKFLKSVASNKGVFGSSLRLSKKVPALLAALCRLTLSERPSAWHFKKAGDLLRLVSENHRECLKTSRMKSVGDSEGDV